MGGRMHHGVSAHSQPLAKNASERERVVGERGSTKRNAAAKPIDVKPSRRLGRISGSDIVKKAAEPGPIHGSPLKPANNRPPTLAVSRRLRRKIRRHPVEQPVVAF